MWVGKGIVLVGVRADKQLENGLRYQVVKLPAGEGAACVVQNVDDRGALMGEPLSVEAKRLATTLRLSHTICYFSSQARTIVGGLRLSQTRSRHFSIRHLADGFGRAGEGLVVEVE